MDRLTLLHAFANGSVILWPWNGGKDTVRGRAEAVEREDGSGYSFNVRVRLWSESGETTRTVNVYVSCHRR